MKKTYQCPEVESINLFPSEAITVEMGDESNPFFFALEEEEEEEKKNATATK